MESGSGQSRPARRHAHTCRTCNETFSCKAELLEHEQEAHVGASNTPSHSNKLKAERAKHNSGSSIVSTELATPTKGEQSGSVSHSVGRKSVRGPSASSSASASTTPVSSASAAVTPGTTQQSVSSPTAKTPSSAHKRRSSSTAGAVDSAPDVPVVEHIVIDHEEIYDSGSTGIRTHHASQSVIDSVNVAESLLTLHEACSSRNSEASEHASTKLEDYANPDIVPEASMEVIAESISRPLTVTGRRQRILPKNAARTSLPYGDGQTPAGKRKKSAGQSGADTEGGSKTSVVVLKLGPGISAAPSKGTPSGKGISVLRVRSPSQSADDSAVGHSSELRNELMKGTAANSSASEKASSASEPFTKDTRSDGTAKLPSTSKALGTQDIGNVQAEADNHTKAGVKTSVPRYSTPAASGTGRSQARSVLSTPSSSVSATNSTKTIASPRMVSVLLRNIDSSSSDVDPAGAKTAAAAKDALPKSPNSSEAAVSTSSKTKVESTPAASSDDKASAVLRLIRSGAPVLKPLQTRPIAQVTGADNSNAATTAPVSSDATKQSSEASVEPSSADVAAGFEKQQPLSFRSLITSGAVTVKPILSSTSGTSRVIKIEPQKDTEKHIEKNENSADCIQHAAHELSMATEDVVTVNVSDDISSPGSGHEPMSHITADSLGNYVCKHCGTEFSMHLELRKHMRACHDRARPHKCTVCDKGFPFACNLAEHMSVHSSGELARPFECSQCQKSFARISGLRKHTKEEHLIGPRPYVCPHCNKSFVYRCALEGHIRKHTGVRPYSCLACGAGFKHLSNLQKHKKMLHPGPCEVCQDATLTCEHAKAARAASKEKGFACLVCMRQFISAAALAVHERAHTGEKPETCDICGRCFQHRSNLQRHLMKHAGKRPFQCPQCPRTFFARHSLQAHMRRHTGDSPYACDVCEKRFCTKNSLRVHMNLHANVKPFSCDACGRSFAQLGNLQKHMTVHTGERPYTCTECQRTFVDLTLLKRHRATIHDRDARYACDICDKRFLHQSSVRVHRLLHEGIKPHKCVTCGKCFTHRSGWLRHSRLHDRSGGEEIMALVGSGNSCEQVMIKPGEYIVYLTE